MHSFKFIIGFIIASFALSSQAVVIDFVKIANDLKAASGYEGGTSDTDLSTLYGGLYLGDKGNNSMWDLGAYNASLSGLYMGIRGDDRPNSSGVPGNEIYHGYLDSGKGANAAGLGVCKVLNNNGECAPAGDDNVTSNERLRITFWETTDPTKFNQFSLTSVSLSDMIFRDAKHNPIDVSKRIDFKTEPTPGGFNNMSFGALSGSTQSGQEFHFAYRNSGSNGAQFYLSSINIHIPEPASLSLLALGIAGLSLLRKRLV